MQTFYRLCSKYGSLFMACQELLPESLAKTGPGTPPLCSLQEAPKEETSNQSPKIMFTALLGQRVAM